jgi:cysteine-rich repeat protein
MNKHTKPALRTQLLFGAFVLTAALGLSSASMINDHHAINQEALLLRKAAGSSSSAAKSSKRVQTLTGVRNVKFARPARVRVDYSSLKASSSSRVAIKAACGDKLINYGEVCDDGNAKAGDGCSVTCAVETGFFCDGSQPSDCWSICGDGVVATIEKCDDGNTTSGDGCTASCKIEITYKCTGSPSVCAVPAYCGNGIVETGEACDDGDTDDWNGCTVKCAVSESSAS